MKTTLTITAAAALAGLFPAVAVSAQDRPPVQQPTVKEALEALEIERDPEVGSYDLNVRIGPAVAILRQTSGPRRAAELAGLAAKLGEMVADTTLPRDVRRNASIALTLSASDAYNDGGTPRPYNDGGTPYPRAFDILVRVYEGGIDEKLYSIFAADPERGTAYVRDLFERSERPALCFRGEVWGRIPAPGDPPDCVGDPGETPWCRAGGILYKKIVDEAKRRTWPSGVIMQTAGDPQPVPDGLPEHVEDWHRRCL